MPVDFRFSYKTITLENVTHHHPLVIIFNHIKLKKVSKASMTIPSITNHRLVSDFYNTYPACMYSMLELSLK